MYSGADQSKIGSFGEYTDASGAEMFFYIANVGDSRCILSMDCGTSIAALSRDHKPEDELEKNRIQLAGGKIYRTQTFAKQAVLPNDKDLYV